MEKILENLVDSFLDTRADLKKEETLRADLISICDYAQTLGIAKDLSAACRCVVWPQGCIGWLPRWPH